MYVLRLPQIKKQVKARTNIQLTGHLLFIVLIMPKFAFIKFCNIFKKSKNDPKTIVTTLVLKQFLDRFLHIFFARVKILHNVRKTNVQSKQFKNIRFSRIMLNFDSKRNIDPKPNLTEGVLLAINHIPSSYSSAGGGGAGPTSLVSQMFKGYCCESELPCPIYSSRVPKYCVSRPLYFLQGVPISQLGNLISDH